MAHAATRIASVAAAWLLLSSAVAAPVEPQVRVDRNGDYFSVTAHLAVEVDRGTAWSVITDYEHLRDFVPEMEESRVVSAPGQPLLVRQKGAWSLFGYRIPVQIVARVDEQPMRSVRFHSVSGNVRVENGEWTIEEQGHGVAIRYRVDCDPDFWIPTVIGRMLIRRDVRDKLEGVAYEMLKRDVAQRDGSSRDAASTGAVR